MKEFYASRLGKYLTNTLLMFIYYYIFGFEFAVLLGIGAMAGEMDYNNK